MTKKYCYVVSILHCNPYNYRIIYYLEVNRNKNKIILYTLKTAILTMFHLLYTNNDNSNKAKFNISNSANKLNIKHN